MNSLKAYINQNKQMEEIPRQFTDVRHEFWS